MNFRMIGQVVGRVLCIEAALMLLPMIAALAYDESPVPFLITIAVTGGIGLVMWRVRAKSGGMTARDGFLIVGLSWIAMSLFGALLFVLTGDIPNYIDALFETISGLTTTGASVVTSPESMTRGGMFWRLFTHWIGGMGILVFVLAVLPMSGNRSMHIMRAEVPGPTVGKLVPRIRKTASILYLLYIALTLVETVLLIAVETKKIDLPDDNKSAVFSRMISERNNIVCNLFGKYAGVVYFLTPLEVAVIIAL